MSAFVFWVGVATITYALGAFPALVAVRALLLRRPFERARIEPSVSVVVTVHDEAAVIASKLDNISRLDYPAHLLEVVVASDGSTDGTNEIVAARAGTTVKLVALPRVGKAAAIDRGAQEARGSILVFTDANSMFGVDALRELVAPFADPAVGGVAGNQRYTADAPGVAAGERGYWSFDTALKRAESSSGSVVSATGAIYAIRRELYERPVDGVTDDFAISTGVIAAGSRLVFAPDAIAYEPPTASHGAEYGRKVRVMTRGLRAVAFRRRLLDPRRSGFYAVQLATHKALRRLLVVPLAAVAASTPFLATRGPVYAIAGAAQVLVYAAGGLGLLLAPTRVGKAPVLSIPAYFCMVNAAAAHALWNVLAGRRIERWEPSRTSTSGGA